jgi:hypothetical protein
MTLAHFDALGGVWPADPGDPAIKSAIFMGFPRSTPSRARRRSCSGPGARADIEIGDIFDETGVPVREP